MTATPRRNGNSVYYRIAEQAEQECRRVRGAIKSFAADEMLRKDVHRLRTVKELHGGWLVPGGVGQKLS